MALVTGLSLGQAGRLLDRLARSQDQLARVTRIEADINALLLGSYEDADRPSQIAAMENIRAQVAAYVDTIEEERALIGGGAEAEASQAREAEQGEALSALVAELQTGLNTLQQSLGYAPLVAAEQQRARLHSLAQQIEAGEDAEARAAIEDMRRLKNRATASSIALFGLMALLCAMGAWAVAANMGRPLRRLEEAAGRLGEARPEPEPVRPQGFAEIQHLAHAFNRLDAEVTAQRKTLARHAEGLEAEVAERTREIEASRERLAEIDRTRKSFFSKVSHELRTPATVIRGEAEVALRDPNAPAEDLREALEHVAANSAFLQRRLDDLLALARAEDGRIALRREPIRLNRLLSEVVALAEPYTRSSGLVLLDEGLEQPDLVIEGDASWLQQAVLALVDNAAKFAAGGPAVRLSLRAEDGAATIGVADGGPGVDPEALPFLFESFYRAPDAGGKGGAGVGLSVTRWVVEQHGGEVTARNVDGQGLLIELRLPLGMTQ